MVAIAPYGVLSNAVLNICHDYARFLPQAIIKAEGEPAGNNRDGPLPSHLILLAVIFV